VVNANVIDGTNLVVPDASLVFHSAERVSIIGNKIINNQTGGPIGMKGSSKDWLIAGNSFAQNISNSPTPLSADSTVINNSGYNPVGTIALPWHPERRADQRRRGQRQPGKRAALHGQTKCQDDHHHRRHRGADRDRRNPDRPLGRGIQIGYR